MRVEQRIYYKDYECRRVLAPRLFGSVALLSFHIQFSWVFAFVEHAKSQAW
jgi:hypothetical protein